VVAVLLLAISFSLPVKAQNAAEFPEYQLKAAFIYNFAKFIGWPATAFASADAPLVIGVLGEDPFGSALKETVEGKTVNGRKLEIKYFKHGDAIAGCHILFISRSEKENVATVLSVLQGKSILTVADFDGFGKRGGMMTLLVAGKSVRFEINLEAAEQAGLKVSSKLGALGLIVKTEPEKGGK
jgi:hypothetical protein